MRRADAVQLRRLLGHEDPDIRAQGRELLLALSPEDLHDVLHPVKRWVRFDLHSLDLRGLDLRGRDLRGTNLREADLSGCDLTGIVTGEEATDLRGACLKGAQLKRLCAHPSHLLLSGAGAGMART